MKTGDKVIVPAEINGYGRDLRAIVTEIACNSIQNQFQPRKYIPQCIHRVLVVLMSY